MIARARGAADGAADLRGRRACRRLQRDLRARPVRQARPDARGRLRAMRAALLQLCSGDDPAANLAVTEALVREAAAGGAGLVLTPECTNIVSLDRDRQRAVLVDEAEDPTLARLREVAAELGVWLLIGSLCLRSGGRGRALRQPLVPDRAGRGGARPLRQDPHVRRGARRRARATARVARLPAGRAGGAGGGGGAEARDDGLLRPALSAALPRPGAGGGGGADACPPPSPCRPGEAHWHVLLRARAIETGAYVLAPAQSGMHPAASGPARRTYGHSLAVSPWGEVLADARRGGRGRLRRDRPGGGRARPRHGALARARPGLCAAGRTVNEPEASATRRSSRSSARS